MTERRGSFDASLASFVRDRALRVRAALGLAPRPSWQARVMNACTRVMMKPLMRFGSVESMRSMSGRLDEQQSYNFV